MNSVSNILRVGDGLNRSAGVEFRPDTAQFMLPLFILCMSITADMLSDHP